MYSITRKAVLLVVALCCALGMARKPVAVATKTVEPSATPVPAIVKRDDVRVTSGPFKGTIASPPDTMVKVQPKPGLQSDRWRKAKVNPKDTMRLDKEVAWYLRNKEVYEKLEKIRSNGVPAPVIFCFHLRESDHSFSRHLHEGSLLAHRTVDVPKGRLPNSPPPYTFPQSAEDALYDYEHLEKRDWHNLEPALQAAESYNGLGYQRKGRVSPYMWAGTDIYTGGKYVKDGVFSATAYDAQLGICSVMKRMQSRGIALQFDD